MKISKQKFYSFLIKHARELHLSHNEVVMCENEKGCERAGGCSTRNPFQYMLNNFLHVIAEKYPNELQSLYA
jgi:hypothetical protein